MSRLVVDAHSDLDLGGTKVRLRSSSTGHLCRTLGTDSKDTVNRRAYMTVLQADANSPNARCYPLSGRVHLVQACSPLREGTSNLVHDTGSCKTPADGLKTQILGDLNRYAPTADNLPLRLAHSDIIADDHELNTVSLVGMLSSILLLRQTEVQDVSCVVSGVSVKIQAS